MERRYLRLLFTMEEFIRLEPRLKKWFGIDRNNPYLQELFGNYASIKLKESPDKERYINEKGHYSQKEMVCELHKRNLRVRSDSNSSL